MRKDQRTNHKYRNLVGPDQQICKSLKKTELRKADRTVGVNCNIFYPKYITVNPNRTVSLSEFSFFLKLLKDGGNS